ncbi:MAG: hypothetical protein KDH96_03395 [Candidatus Riesia sp.]|nr:hypothetical protein [Candidatus Riesia sp.]
MNELKHLIINEIEKNNLTFKQSKLLIKEYYFEEIDYVEKNELFNIKVRGVDKSILQQPGWLQHYAILATEIHACIDVIETEMEYRKSEIWKELTENHKFDLSQMDKQNYILSDEKYFALKRFLIILREIKEQLTNVVDSFKSLGFALNSYVRSREGAIQID